MASHVPANLKGSYCPMVVPFRDGNVDYDSYADLVERQIKEGSSGILVNPTSGEPTTLTVEERRSLVETAMDVAAGRVPVCAGTASESHAQTVKLVEEYQKLGVDSICVVTPFYIVPPQVGLEEFFVDVAKRTDRPVIAYHIPSKAAVRVQAETFARVRARAANFVGLKNTDTDLGMVHELFERVGTDFRLFAGLETTALAMLAAGGVGVMITTCNVMPQRVAELCASIERGDLQRAQQINIELQPLYRAAGAFNGPIAVKYMLERMGVLSRAEYRLPMVPVPDEIARGIDRTLDHYGLLTA